MSEPVTTSTKDQSSLAQDLQKEIKILEGENLQTKLYHEKIYAYLAAIMGNAFDLLSTQTQQELSSLFEKNLLRKNEGYSERFLKGLATLIEKTKNPHFARTAIANIHTQKNDSRPLQNCQEWKKCKANLT